MRLMTDTAMTALKHEGLKHEGLLYRDRGELLAETVPVALAALETGEPVLAVFDSGIEKALKNELGTAAREIDFRPAREVFGWPPQTVTTVIRRSVEQLTRVGTGATVLAHHPEVVDPRSKTFWEAVLNTVLAKQPVTLVCACPSDHPAAPISRVTHPLLRRGGTAVDNPDFRDPAVLLAENPPTAPAPLGEPTARRQVHDSAELSGLRLFSRQHALRAGLFPDSTDSLILAVNEALTDALERAAGAAGQLDVWVAPSTITCEVSGPGHFTDPYLGVYRRPGHAIHLWAIQEFCDTAHLWNDHDGGHARMAKHA